MITEKEVTEYRDLCTRLGELHGKYLRKKEELCLLLEQTAAQKREALLFLIKANRLTRHLTGRQRLTSGLTYSLGDIKARIQDIPALYHSFPGNGEVEIMPEIRPVLQADWRSGRELKQKLLLILKMIDAIRKKLFQFELLELRCRELLVSIKKALEAFRHEWENIRRKIYPLGIFSMLVRRLRRLWGASYFSRTDMKDLAALGSITGYVLKIADSPLF